MDSPRRRYRVHRLRCGGDFADTDQLHVSCGIEQPGSEGDGTWMCTDGIGYLWVSVVLGAMLAFSVLAEPDAGLVRPARAACLVLVLLAAAMTAWILGWTWHASSELVWAVPPDTLSVDYWYAAVPTTIASAVAFLPALVRVFAQGAAAASVRRGCRGTAHRHGPAARAGRQHPRRGRTPRGRCGSCSEQQPARGRPRRAGHRTLVRAAGGSARRSTGG